MKNIKQEIRNMKKYIFPPQVILATSRHLHHSVRQFSQRRFDPLNTRNLKSRKRLSSSMISVSFNLYLYLRLFVFVFEVFCICISCICICISRIRRRFDLLNTRSRQRSRERLFSLMILVRYKDIFIVFVNVFVFVFEFIILFVFPKSSNSRETLLFFNDICELIFSILLFVFLFEVFCICIRKQLEQLRDAVFFNDICELMMIVMLPPLYPLSFDDILARCITPSSGPFG